jgi:hypothetical protein
LQARLDHHASDADGPTPAVSTSKNAGNQPHTKVRKSPDLAPEDGENKTTDITNANAPRRGRSDKVAPKDTKPIEHEPLENCTKRRPDKTFGMLSDTPADRKARNQAAAAAPKKPPRENYPVHKS